MSVVERFVVLTQQQAEILRRLLEGKTQVEIAAELGVRYQALWKIVDQLRRKGLVP